MFLVFTASSFMRVKLRRKKTKNFWKCKWEVRSRVRLKFDRQQLAMNRLELKIRILDSDSPSDLLEFDIKNNRIFTVLAVLTYQIIKTLRNCASYAQILSFSAFFQNKRDSKCCWVHTWNSQKTRNCGHFLSNLVNYDVRM